jgi:hypothetical protein
LRLESENQMKEVVKEYEKTISELIADNKREKTKLEVGRRTGDIQQPLVYHFQ